jgi:hypothetical protein
MITVCGQICTRKGLVQNHPDTGIDPYSMPSASYRRQQPVGVPLRFDHDPEWNVGEVVHLERSNATGLMAVGVIEDDQLAPYLREHGPWYFSDLVVGKRMGPAELGQGRLGDVSLVRATANLNTRPVAWARHDITLEGGGAPRELPLFWHGTWQRAHERTRGARYSYERNDRLPIWDMDELTFAEEMITDPAAALARSRATTEAGRREIAMWRARAARRAPAEATRVPWAVNASPAQRSPPLPSSTNVTGTAGPTSSDTYVGSTLPASSRPSSSR